MVVSFILSLKVQPAATTWKTASVVHRGQLTQLARHLTSDGDAEDYVHDAYVAALSADKAPTAPGQWLRQVLRNSVRQKGRRRQRWEDLQRLVPAPNEEPTPESYVQRAELSAAVKSALNDLDPKFQDVLRKRFFGEATSREIARSLGCPQGTVRWRLHEGLRRVKHALDERFGQRDRWYGGVFALGVPSAGAPAIPITPTEKGASSMFTPSLLKILLSLTAAGSVATVAFGELPGGADDPAVGGERNLVAEAETRERTDDAESLRRKRSEVAAAEAPQRADRSGGADSVSLPDVEDCGREEIAAFNASDGDPNADEHLVDAARCYEEGGFLGKVALIHTLVRRRFPNSPNAEASRKALLRIYPRLLDPNEATRSPLAQACTAPIREADGDVDAAEYIAAADCVWPGGLVGLELSLRKAAKAKGGDIDHASNDVSIEKLEKYKADSLKRLAKLRAPSLDTEKQDNAISPGVQASVECGRLHRPKEGAPPAKDGVDPAVGLAGCFADRGLLGKAILVQELLLRDDADGRHRPVVRKAILELVPRILDADEASMNPLGRTCIAPLVDRGNKATAEEYLTAAACLQEGTMVGAATAHLKRALEIGGDFDRGAVRRDLKRLGALKAEYEAKEKKYRDAN